MKTGTRQGWWAAFAVVVAAGVGWAQPPVPPPTVALPPPPVIKPIPHASPIEGPIIGEHGHHEKSHGGHEKAHGHESKKSHAHEDEHEEGIGDLIIDGEYFLLAPRRTGQTYAIEGRNPFWGPLGGVRSLDGSYDSGFRIGAGWRFEEGVEVFGRYTYYHSAADDVARRPSASGAVFATLTHPSTVVEVDSARALNSLNLNIVDFEFGKRHEISEEFSLRWFAGPRYANLDQKLQVIYAGGDVSTSDVRRRLFFDGGGIRAGGETNWKFIETMGFYARGSASMLTGRFRGDLSETTNGAPIVNVSERFTRVIPIVDLGVGLSYQKGGFRLSVGYEFINWFGMVDGLDFADDANPGKITRQMGSLGFDGVVFRSEFKY